MDYLNVLVQISFLRKACLALLALVGTLASVSPQVLEKLAHRENSEATFMLHIKRRVLLKWLFLNATRVFD